MSQVRIQKRLDRGGSIVFTPGRYPIKLLYNSNYVPYRKVGYSIRSNSTISFCEGVVFELMPTSEAYYHIIDLSGAHDVSLKGCFRIIGNCFEKESNNGEWGHGIAFNGAKHIYVDSVSVSNCQGDGVRFGSLDDSLNPKDPLYESPEDIKIKYIESSNNKRLGVGITNALDVHINKVVASSNNGTAPRAGIDIEPNYDYELLSRLVIDTLITNKNYGGGLWFIPINCALNRIDILINHYVSINDGQNDYSSEGAIRVTSKSRVRQLDGSFRINNLEIINPQKRGVYFNNWSSKDCDFLIGTLTSINSNLDDIIIVLDDNRIEECNRISIDTLNVSNSRRRNSWLRIIGNDKASVDICIGQTHIENNDYEDVEYSKIKNEPKIRINNKIIRLSKSR